MEGANVQVSPGEDTVYRASALGGCVRALAAERHGYEKVKSPSSQTGGGLALVFAEGNLHEIAVIERLRNEGWTITSEQEEVVLQLSGGKVVGHIDGKAALTTTLDSPLGMEKVVLNQLYLLEVKSMGDQQYKAWVKHRWETPGLVQKYRWQLAIYSIALELPILFAVKNRNNGQLDLSVLESPFYTLQDIQERISEVENGHTQLPSCDTTDFWCPYLYLHEETTELTIDTLLETTVKEYLAIVAEEKEIKERKEEARGKVDTAMGTRNSVTLPIANITRYSTSRKELQKSKLEEDLAEIGHLLDDYYVTMPGTESFKVTPKKEDDDSESV